MSKTNPDATTSRLSDQVDILCDEFEKQLIEGKKPNIDDYLARIPESERESLLHELLTLAIDYRPESNETLVSQGGTAIFGGQGNRRCEAGSYPSRIGQYQIRQRIGAGGFAEVFLAFDELAKREVALKVPKTEAYSHGVDLDRFLDEARAAAKLRHPGIVSLLNVSRESDGTIYIVLEYVEGETLKDMISRQPPSHRQTAELIAKVAEAVHHAHGKGLIHRDVKPANILVDRFANPRITDFGLAIHEDVQRQLVGERSGTLAYMSPEQIRGETHRLDGRTDIWSLGVVLYEMLVGHRPFHGDTWSELSDEILNRDPKPPRMIDDKTPQWLERICLKCLAKKTTERFTNAGDLASELREGDVPRQISPVFRAHENPCLDENVQFTVFRPRAIRPDCWYKVLSFAHFSELPADAPDDQCEPTQVVQEMAEDILGGQSPGYSDNTQDSSQAVPREGLITFFPTLPGLEVRPTYRTFAWNEPVHVEQFEIRAPQQLVGKTVRGRVAVYLGSLILAELALSIKVDVHVGSDRSEHAQARRFKRIYASYSAADLEVVRQFEGYAWATGDTFLTTCAQLREQEVWADQVKELICDADVFQLFWSSNSMRSSFVRNEWEFALSLGRADFICPTYWESPLPCDPDAGLPPHSLRVAGFRNIDFSSKGRGGVTACMIAPTDLDSENPGGAASPVVDSGESKYRACPLCGSLVSMNQTNCPECASDLRKNWTAPVAKDKVQPMGTMDSAPPAKKEGEEALCRHKKKRIFPRFKNLRRKGKEDPPVPSSLEQVVAAKPSAETAVRMLYLMSLEREPNSQELSLALSFLSDPPPEEAIRSYSQMLENSDECQARKRLPRPDLSPETPPLSESAPVSCHRPDSIADIRGTMGTRMIGASEAPSAARMSLEVLAADQNWSLLSVVGDTGLELGRAEGDFTFADNFAMAARHARFSYKKDGLLVEDLGSRNGIFKKVVEPVGLQNGQLFRVGSHLIQFRLPPELAEYRGSDSEQLWTRNLAAHGVAALIDGDGADAWRFPLLKPITTFGRDAEQVDVALAGDVTCGVKHAMIRHEESQHWLEDAGSQTGTYVRISDELLVFPGDILLIGVLLIRVSESVA